MCKAEITWYLKSPSTLARNDHLCVQMMVHNYHNITMQHKTVLTISTFILQTVTTAKTMFIGGTERHYTEWQARLDSQHMRLTEERSNKERREWNVDDRWDHVDEPVRQKRRDTEEHNVIEQVLTMSLHLHTARRPTEQNISLIRTYVTISWESNQRSCHVHDHINQTMRQKKWTSYYC